MAEPVQLSAEKRNLRSQDDCSDEKKKDALENRKEAADDPQCDKNPSQEMPDKRIHSFLHQIIN